MVTTGEDATHLKRTLLVVSYEFPPAGGAGMKRLLKFLRYLPENGWRPIMLTARNANLDLADPSLLKELDPNLEIHRATTLENLFQKGVSIRVRRAGVVAHQGSRSSIRYPAVLLRRFYKWAGGFLKVPDSRILWLPTALVVGLWLVVSRRPASIFASGPSFTNLVLAATLRRLTGVRLVVDFRDAWVSDPMFRVSRRHLRAAHRLMEAFVVRTANVIVSTNPYVTTDFRVRYPHLSAKTWATTYNGFDDADYAYIQSCERNLYKGRFAIVFTGRLYGERTPYHFLAALRSAFDHEPHMRMRTTVAFVGSCEAFLDGRTIGAYIKQLGLGDVVELTGHLTRARSLEYQVEASVLLLLIGIVDPRNAYTYGISGKVFDYLVSERPILALAEDGASKAFLLDNGLAEVYSHWDEEGIMRYLIRAYQLWRQGEALPYCPRAKYGRFDFRTLTATLAGHLSGTRRKGGL
jgi:glycosyltransferase involved in cell wall biosynthesis